MSPSADGGSAGLTWAFRSRTWAKKSRVELCFNPTYASWANPIEAHFGPLRQFTVANFHHPDHHVQTRALHAYLSWRNKNARHPEALAVQRRERARIRSEKGIRWGGRPALAACGPPVNSTHKALSEFRARNSACASVWFPA
jgi:hypothetical protein